MQVNKTPKHLRIFESLRQDIRDGRWQPGERMPTEAQLMKRFDVSRITVSRAMQDLKVAEFVERRPGSGTYVKPVPSAEAMSFGLLIPELGETEIFEPICHGMMMSPLADRHALLWGHSLGRDRPDNQGKSLADCAFRLCQQFIERRVSGAFFAPLEHAPGKDDLNGKIARAFQEARIPVILLDRPLRPFPAALQHDLVGIDNRRAGYVVTEHLLGLGCRHLHFIGLAGVASTVDDREAGFREALHVGQLPADRSFVHRIGAEDIDKAVRTLVSAGADGIVCANDRLAGATMHALRRIDRRVPQDLRLVGIDDVEYATLLPVPLTTLRQPTRQIGETALAMMLERIKHPELPVRDIRLQCELIVRNSCGATIDV
jgi:GntR family transcriptional regulator, arabinose operon transcriptional repressor